jgi:two-component system response regulator YesN
MYQVLVAEDEFWIRNQLIELIERVEGFKVVGEARDGEEAWKLMNELWPDVLITDIMMPKMDGLGLLHKVFEYQLAVAPIIISGYDNFSYAQEAMRYGVSEYVLKPVSEQKIRDALTHSIQFMQRTHRHREHLLLIDEYIHRLDALDRQRAWRELAEIVKSILNVKTAAAGEKMGMLRILSDKLYEQTGQAGDRTQAAEWADLSGQDKEAVLSHFYTLLENWFRHLETFPGQNTHQIMKKVQDYIQQSYMKEITLSQIAEFADLSVSRFCVIFKKNTGDSFVNYLNQYRIDKAKQLLLETDLKIYEIADMVGFSTLPYFNRLFKTVTGLSPNEYKRSLGL